MPEAELSLLFVEPLNALGVRYLISGGVAAIVYGEPRFTADLDLVIYLRPDHIPRLVKAFPESDFYCPPAEVITAEIARPGRGRFNIIHLRSGFKADFYPTAFDDFHAWAFRKARQIEYRGASLVVAPPEYIILRKLEFHRQGGSEKHLCDIRAMLRISGDLLDRAALEEWARLRGVEDAWRQVSA